MGDLEHDYDDLWHIIEGQDHFGVEHHDVQTYDLYHPEHLYGHYDHGQHHNDAHYDHGEHHDYHYDGHSPHHAHDSWHHDVVV